MTWADCGWQQKQVCGGVCCGGGEGGSRPAPRPAPPPLSPEQIAFNETSPRYFRVIDMVTQPGAWLIDRKSWISSKPSSPAELAASANQLHRALTDQTAWYEREAAAYDDRNRIYSTYQDWNKRAAELNGEIADIKARLAKIASNSSAYQREAVEIDRATEELQSRTGKAIATIGRSQKVIAAAFRVLLPGGTGLGFDANSIMSFPPGSIDGARSQPSPPDPLAGIAAGIKRASAAPAIPGILGLPDTQISANAPPLSGSLYDHMAQLEADAAKANAAYSHRDRSWHLSQNLEASYDAAKSGLVAAIDRKSQAIDDLFDKQKAAEVLRDKALAAEKRMLSERGRFLAYAAQEWIWENAKKYTLDAIVVEMKKTDYYKQHPEIAQHILRDVSESEILKYYDEHKFNIYNLPDAIQRAQDLREVVKRITTLRQHAEGYATEATRLAAYGSESEIKNFTGNLFAGMTRDSEDLVKANMNTIGVPEPFATVMTKSFLKNDQ